MFGQHGKDVAGRYVAKSAFTGYAEVSNPLRGEGDLVVGNSGIIAGMDDSEKQVSFVPQGQTIQRREIASLARVIGHRKMNPVDGPADQSGYAVGEIHDPVEVRRQRKIILFEIAKTEMQPELHAIGHGFCGSDDTVQNAIPYLIEMNRPPSLDNAELGRQIPLDREIVAGDDRRDFSDLLQQTVLIGRFDRDLKGIIDILPDHAERGSDADLKPAIGGNRPFCLRRGECRIGGFRRGGISQRPELDGGRRKAGPHPVLRSFMRRL